MNPFQRFITSLVLVGLISANMAAFAISSLITLSVKADKKIINADKGVTISGFIAPSIITHGQDLSIKVFNPVGELYLSDSLNLTRLIATGTYLYGFDFNGRPAISGNYEIMVTYGPYDAETVVTYINGNDDPTLYYYVVPIANQTYPIRYKITQGSEVEFMSLDSIANVLKVGVNSSVGNGTLTIEIPRSILDAVQNGNDLNYTAMMVQGPLVLGKTLVHVTEISTSLFTRTLQIGLENGTKEIWIYSTKTGIQGTSQGGNMTLSSSNALLLPLQQLRSGIWSQDVKCRYGFALVIKSEDGSPLVYTLTKLPSLYKGAGQRPRMDKACCNLIS